MKKNTDVDPLRHRDDFRILVAELEGKARSAIETLVHQERLRAPIP